MIHLSFEMLRWLGSEWVLAILVALSVVSVAVALARFLELRTLQRSSRQLWNDHVEAWMQKADPQACLLNTDALQKRYPSLETEALSLLAQARQTGILNVEKALDAFFAKTKMKLEKNVSILGTIGSNAPFIGLLGTVLGIIRAFHSMQSAGGTGIESIGYGIAEALVATAIGLMVAIPAIVFFNILNKRIGLLLKRARSVADFALSGERS